MTDIEDDFFSLAPSRKKKKAQKEPASLEKPPEPIPKPSPPPQEHKPIEITEPTTKKGTRRKRGPRKKVEPPPETSPEGLLEDSSDSESESRNTGSQSSYAYRFSDANEARRMYIVRVRNKLGQGAEWTEFGAHGTKPFSDIHKMVCEHYQNEVQGKQRRIGLAQLSSENTALVWVPGRMELKDFYKPSTLRIPPPEPFDPVTDEVDSMNPTEVVCVLIPRDHVDDLETYPEFQRPKVNEEDPIEIEEETVPVEVYEIEDEPDLKDGYFKIGLKGRDNKRVVVEVSSKTQIRKLLEFYGKSKGIEVDEKKAKLLFDDEVLDMDSLVGDTELEEDFEVQVVI